MPTGFLHEPRLLPGGSSPATGQNPGPEGREPQLTSDACHGPGTGGGGGELLCQPTRPRTRGTPACQMEGEHSRDSFCLPRGDPRGGHSTGLGPSHPTSQAADSTAGQSKRHSGWRVAEGPSTPPHTIAACLGQMQESDPEEQRLGVSGTGRPGSWCPQGRLPGERCPGRGQHLPGTSWPRGQQKANLPGPERNDKHVGGKEAAWTVPRRKSQAGLRQGRDKRGGHAPALGGTTTS